MRIDIVSGVPDILQSPLEKSIIGRARAAGVVEIAVHNLHDYSADRHRTIDDSPYGGGSGMILRCEPVFACIERLLGERAYDDVIYLTADGEKLTQPLANGLSLAQSLILLCGHYKGIDERIRQLLVTREISIGDYVLTGGELPALVLVDTLVRLLPGAVHDSQSLLDDSFQLGTLEPAQYTRPPEFRGLPVPPVLMGGNHAEIRAWREEQAAARTRARRPDLLRREEDRTGG